MTFRGRVWQSGWPTYPLGKLQPAFLFSIAPPPGCFRKALLGGNQTFFPKVSGRPRTSMVEGQGTRPPRFLRQRLWPVSRLSSTCGRSTAATPSRLRRRRRCSGGRCGSEQGLVGALRQFVFCLNPKHTSLFNEYPRANGPLEVDPTLRCVSVIRVIPRTYAKISKKNSQR